MTVTQHLRRFCAAAPNSRVYCRPPCSIACATRLLMFPIFVQFYTHAPQRVGVNLSNLTLLRRQCSCCQNEITEACNADSILYVTRQLDILGWPCLHLFSRAISLQRNPHYHLQSARCSQVFPFCTLSKMLLPIIHLSLVIRNHIFIRVCSG